MTEPGRTQYLSTALYYAALALLFWLVFLVVRPFLVPLCWAAILAILMAPWNTRLAERLGPGRAAAIGTVAATLVLVIPGTLLGIYFIREGIQAAQVVQEMAAGGSFDWATRVGARISERIGLSNVSLGNLIQDAARAIAAFLAGRLAGILGNVIRLIFYLAVVLFSLFYLLRDGKRIMKVVRQLLPFDQPLSERMLTETHDLIQATVSVTFLIAAVQGGICGLAFALVSIGTPIFWALIMGFLALLPFIGPWPIWLPVAIWFLVTGHLVRGITLLVLCGAVAGTIDNLLRPLLLSGRSRLGGLTAFISVLGGIAAFGMLGLVLGPIIVATALAVIEVYTSYSPPAGAP
jgi:predicted PurR-regulated permease PerM